MAGVSIDKLNLDRNLVSVLKTSGSKAIAEKLPNYKRKTKRCLKSLIF
jgi:hypothetical protein